MKKSINDFEGNKLNELTKIKAGNNGMGLNYGGSESTGAGDMIMGSYSSDLYMDTDGDGGIDTIMYFFGDCEGYA